MSACADGSSGPVADAALEPDAHNGLADAAEDAEADAEADLATAPVDPWKFAPLPEPFLLPDAVARQAGHAIDRLSRYTFWSHSPLPPVGARGAIGLGNGRVFGFVGYSDPVLTLHSLTGPTYDRRDAFFPDLVPTVLVDGEALEWQQQASTRSLNAPVALTRASADGIVVGSIDFVPPSGTFAGAECFVRQFWLTGDSEHAVTFAIRSARAGTVDGASLVGVTGERRYVRTQILAQDASASTTGVELAMTLGPEPVWVQVAHCTADGEPPPAVDTALPLRLTLDAIEARYAASMARQAVIELPDPMAQDFVDGMRQTLHVQTSATGAVSPMSQYTRLWVRDCIGPMLAFEALGDLEAMDDLLDALERGAIRNGDFGNSYPADDSGEPVPPPPDWATLPTLADRTAAETPSYLAWMVALEAGATGSGARIDAAWPMLERAMMAQGFSDGDLLPFSGDETFRAAMNAALGLQLETAHHELSWSLNASALWLGASRALTPWLVRLGRTEEADALVARASEVEGAARTAFADDAGCLAAFVDRATGTRSAPFEDATLSPVWGGWLDGDDPLAQSATRCLAERARTTPGRLVTPADPRYAGVPDLGGPAGVYTGMSPGFVLYTLNELGWAEASGALAWLATALDPSGNIQEYQRGDDDTGLQLIYDPQGMVGDYTAKFRPWEGGILLDAAIDRWFGMRVTPDGDLRVRPNPPEGWEAMAVRNWRGAGGEFSVETGWSADGVRVVITNHGDVDRTVWVEVDRPIDAPQPVAGPAFAPAGSIALAEMRRWQWSARVGALQTIEGALR